MKIVSDRGMDLSPEQMAGLEIHLAPLLLTLGGQTYNSGVDIQPDEFYTLLESSKTFPTTSQPSVGDMMTIYQELAATDPDILSIHISAGLSGTYNSARLAIEQVPDARITLFDSKTLSAAEGWQVEAAARASRAGWSLEQTLELLTRIRDNTQTFFTVSTLRYLVHGGRISHMKGLLGSILDIKPIIGVDKETGMYYQVGQAASPSWWPKRHRAAASCASRLCTHTILMVLRRCSCSSAPARPASSCRPARLRRCWVRIPERDSSAWPLRRSTCSLARRGTDPLAGYSDSSLVHRAMRCITMSPVAPRITPGLSRCSDARVMWVSHSSLPIMASRLVCSPRIRKKPFKSPPCESRNTTSNDWMVPACCWPTR